MDKFKRIYLLLRLSVIINAFGEVIIRYHLRITNVLIVEKRHDYFAESSFP